MPTLRVFTEDIHAAAIAMDPATGGATRFDFGPQKIAGADSNLGRVGRATEFTGRFLLAGFAGAHATNKVLEEKDMQHEPYAPALVAAVGGAAMLVVPVNGEWFVSDADPSIFTTNAHKGQFVDIELTDEQFSRLNSVLTNLDPQEYNLTGKNCFERLKNILSEIGVNVRFNSYSSSNLVNQLRLDNVEENAATYAQNVLPGTLEHSTAKIWSAWNNLKDRLGRALPVIGAGFGGVAVVSHFREENYGMAATEAIAMVVDPVDYALTLDAVVDVGAAILTHMNPPTAQELEMQREQIEQRMIFDAIYAAVPLEVLPDMSPEMVALVEAKIAIAEVESAIRPTTFTLETIDTAGDWKRNLEAAYDGYEQLFYQYMEDGLFDTPQEPTQQSENKLAGTFNETGPNTSTGEQSRDLGTQPSLQNAALQSIQKPTNI